MRHEHKLKELSGKVAPITGGSRGNEIFAVNVTLKVMDTAEREGQTIVTVKIDGTFGRTGLPDPLLMNHSFTVVDDSRLAGEQPQT